MTFLEWVLILLGGYILGSLSPAFFIGKIRRGIDIRKEGNRNAGTVNVFRTLGLWPAVLTAVFDLGKGLFAMYGALLLGAPPLLVHLTGCFAIIGHVFPFYLRFRGGQGVATATAILIFYLIIFYINGWLPWETLAILVFAVLSFSYITRRGEVVAVVILPVIAVFVLVFSPRPLFNNFILSIMAYILFIDILNISQSGLPAADTEKAAREIKWRLFLRPAAVILVFYYLRFDKNKTLVLIGAVALFFLALDLIRLVSRRVNMFFFKKVKDFYKTREYKKFSSMTIFLFAAFLTVLFFEKNIAVPALAFLIFGDLFSKLFGITFGRTRVFAKTLEGGLAHFNACLIAGYVFSFFISLPLHILLTGALVAAAAESLPMGIDDNFSVALLSAASMTLFFVF